MAPSNSVTTMVVLRSANWPKPVNRTASQNTRTTRNGQEMAARACSYNSRRVSAKSVHQLQRGGLDGFLRIGLWRQRRDPVEQQGGFVLRLQRHLGSALHGAVRADVAKLGPNDSAQQIARLATVGSKTRDCAIELDQVDADLPDLRLLRFVRSMRGKNQRAADDCRDGRDQTHHELDHIAGIAVRWAVAGVRAGRARPRRRRT
jgi:hypothetical protein